MKGRNMNARNFGLGSRDIFKAAKIALKLRNLSFGSVATEAARFSQFAKWLDRKYGIHDLRWITKAHVIEYAEQLAERVEHGSLEKTTAHNYLSAVNTVLKEARLDEKVWVSPIRHLPPREGIATINRAPTEKQVGESKSILQNQKWGDRLVVVADAAQFLGTRYEECVKANYQRWAREAEKYQEIKIREGTKGGFLRRVPIRTKEQMDIIKRGAELQGKDRSLIPASCSYKYFREHSYRAVAKTSLEGWHGLRHLYAQRRFQNLLKQPCPVVAGIRHGVRHHRFLAERSEITLQMAKKFDLSARKQIARELGHKRPDVTNSYLG